MRVEQGGNVHKRAAMVMLLSAGLVIGIPAAAGAASAGEAKVKATLTGEAEVPGPGDPNAKGQFKATLGEDTLCYSLRVTKVARVSAAHIHAGAEDEAGPVVVTL